MCYHILLFTDTFQSLLGPSSKFNKGIQHAVYDIQSHKNTKNIQCTIYDIPPEDVLTLTLWWGLCGHMILRAMLAVAYATGRQVKGDEPDKKGYPGPPGWGFGVGLTTPQ